MKEIIVRPIYLERFAYWLIVLVLIFMLAKGGTEDLFSGFSSLEDDLLANYNKTGENESNASLNVTSQNETNIPESDPEPEETCDDGIKNQDETQIDCGGVCGGYYYDDACHEEPKEIGRLTFALDSVSWEYGSEAETNARVSSVKITVDNSLDSVASGYRFQVFVYDDNDLDYVKTLNQVGTADDYTVIPDVAKDDALTETFSFSGKLFTDLDETKNVDLKIYDSGLNLITTESDFLTIS